MPFLKIKVNRALTADKEESIKTKVGQAIRHIPGKTEASLLLAFEDRCHLWLGGKNDETIAYIEAAVFGKEDHIGFEAFTSEVTGILSSELNIRADRIYIKYEDIASWGVQGMFIDRRMYE